MAFKNQDRFSATIAKLPPTVASAVRQAMEQSADEIVEAMKRLVPVHLGTLRDSINWCWGPAPSDAKLFTTLSSRKVAGLNDRRISIFAGSFDAYYARWVEFGTRAHPPGAYRDAKGKKHNAGKRGHAATPAHPFFFPVWRAYKRRLRSRISRIVNQAIKALAKSQNGK